ncbi:MAG: hypothetical protein AABY14_02625 [Nanoarchaeota archaeon]
MAENHWIVWIKSNILEIIILILVLVLLAKGFSPMQEVNKIQAGEVVDSKEVCANEPVEPPIIPVESLPKETMVEEKSTV